jgi:hypothetical protein
MSGDTIQDFIDNANALDALRKRVDERLIKFLAAAKCLVGVDSQQRERWRSVTTTTMWVPDQIDNRVAISPGTGSLSVRSDNFLMHGIRHFTNRTEPGVGCSVPISHGC